MMHQPEPTCTRRCCRKTLQKAATPGSMPPVSAAPAANMVDCKAQVHPPAPPPPAQCHGVAAGAALRLLAPKTRVQPPGGARGGMSLGIIVMRLAWMPRQAHDNYGQATRGCHICYRVRYRVRAMGLGQLWGRAGVLWPLRRGPLWASRRQRHRHTSLLGRLAPCDACRLDLQPHVQGP